jgi:integrase
LGIYGLRVARWAHLLEEDENFRRWFNNIARGSRVSAFEAARILYRFLRHHEMTPKTLADLAKKDRRKVENILMDFVTKLHEEKKAPNYINNYVKAVQSWLNHNEVRLVRKIKIGNRNATPTIADERVPLKKELRQILNYANERGKCSISLIAFSGLRPQVLGDMRGEDGLKVKDLPEMKVLGKNVEFSAIPTKVVVRSELSKARHKYFTFLPSEGCEYLKDYLEKRLATGESFSSLTAIISVKKGYEETGSATARRTSGHITTKTVTKEIRKTMRPRFKWRPYVLRAYFDTQLLVAENHGKISHAYRQFFMGHKGDIEARYTTNKGRLPEPVIEDMRLSIQKCEEYLSTRPVSREVDPELTTIKTMVESGVLDFTKPKVRAYLIQKLNIQDMKVRVAKLREQGIEEEEANTRVIFGELGIEPIEIQVSKPKSNGDPKKIISENDLEAYLADGWNVQFVLPSGKILVQRDY